MISFLDRWFLTILVLVPALGAGAVLLVRGMRAVWWTALGIALSTFVLSLLLLVPFRWSKGTEYGYGPGGTVRMVLAAEWVAPVHAEYRVAVDGLSYPFLVLTTFLTSIAILSAARAESSRRPYVMMLLFECTVLGTFVAFDLLLFFLFTAFMLLPATWLAGRGATADQRSPAPKLFAYLLVGLVCLLVMMLGEYAVSRQALGGTFDLVQLASAPMHRQLMTPQLASASRTLFALAIVAFLIRLPVVPLHSWFVELVGNERSVHSLLLLSLIPTTGVYGLLRVACPLFPGAGASLGMAFAVLAVISILYSGCCALGQEDLWRAIAYAGISMIGFALLGAIVMNPTGGAAAVYVSLFTALALAMLLLLTRALVARMEIGDGWRAADVLEGAPLLSALWTLAWFAWLVTPGLLGQALVILSIVQPSGGIRSSHAYAIAIAASLGVLITGAYVIATARRMFFAGSRPSASVPDDLRPREMPGIALVAAVLIALGVIPGVLCFSFIHPALDALFRSLLF